MKSKIDSARELLFEIRNGDYAHPGDIEAINIVFNLVKKFLDKKYTKNPYKKLKIIDIGCGYGGTVKNISERGQYSLIGIDIDKNSIEYAKNKYSNPDIMFVNQDFLTLNLKNKKNCFDIFFMFNVLYSINEKDSCMKKITDLSKKGSLLIIFDYYNNFASSCFIYDLTNTPMQPIVLFDFKNFLYRYDWKIVNELNLSIKFINWYEDFLRKLIKNKKKLLNKFTINAFNKVKQTFENIVENIKKGNLGGICLIAQKI